jgi:hypothetical protein
MQKGGVSMNHGKEQAGEADWGFVAFIILITAIAVALVWTQIYLQNPQ